MRLTVTRDSSIVSEYRFARGPVYIGRHAHSQVFLPNPTISRHHAVIHNTKDKKWFIEDQDSINKTYLNDQPIHKALLKNGSIIRIADFEIKVDLEPADNSKMPIDLQDTLPAASKQPSQNIITLNYQQVQKTDLSKKRKNELEKAAEAINEQDNLVDIVETVIKITKKQFIPLHAWAAVRTRPRGPMTCHGGKSMAGTSIKIAELKFKDKIDETVEKGLFFLIPNVPRTQAEELHSVMIAPIINENGCFGAIYIDNTRNHQAFDTEDLKYLAKISELVATKLNSF